MVVLTSFPPPSVGIRHRQPNTSAHVENKDLGSGTLYIAESRVSWVSEEGQGFSLEYPAISLHAISRDPTAFPKECLYLMVDAKLDDNSEKEIEDEDDDEDEVGDDDHTPVTEIRFVPLDNTILDTMYRTMSDCQTLHPDPNDSISEEDEDEDGDNFEDAEDDDSQIMPPSAQIGAGDSLLPSQLPVPNVFGGVNQSTNANNHSDDEPMDVSQFEDAEPEH